MDEGLDIPPLGYAIFGLLTGLWPYHEYTEHQVPKVQRLVIRGEPPYIHPDYRSNRASFEERRMVQLLYKCIAPNVTDRPDVFEVVRYLQETKRLLHERASEKE